MAQVFLSYDREDGAKARVIAQALERAGHSVWWDRHIEGGAQFSKEIERALENADAVVVLWSRFSIDSAWVRDEAAAGRDRQRLVPVMLEPVAPPMGFRQYQCVELSHWKGRGAAPVERILTAIEGVTGTDAGTARKASFRLPEGGQPLWASPQSWRATLAIVLSLAAIIALGVWQPWRTRIDAPMVAVIPAASNPSATSVADDLLVKLGVLQSVHADALQLVDVSSRRPPDFLIKVGSGGAGARSNLMLVDNSAGTLLWSEEFSAPSGKSADLRQQMAYSAAKVLECAVQALSADGARLPLATLKLYLSGCANLSRLLIQDPAAAVGIFEKVTGQAPKFEGAWKKLLLADIQRLRVAGRDDPNIRRVLQERIVQARRWHPQIAEGYLAEAWLRAPRPLAGWISLVRRALDHDQQNPDILAYQSLFHSNVGLMQDALADTRRAVQSDPLSPAARDILITALLNSGQVEAARSELNTAERLWPGATNVLRARFAIDFRVGDAERAKEMMRSGQLGIGFTPTTAEAWSAHESYLDARIAPTPSNRSKAIASARSFYDQDPSAAWVVARALSEFGTTNELIAFLSSSDASVPPNTTWTLFRTTFAALHHDPRFMAVARRYGLVDYWRTSGKWPDFCREPDLPYDCKAEADKLS